MTFVYHYLKGSIMTDTTTGTELEAVRIEHSDSLRSQIENLGEGVTSVFSSIVATDQKSRRKIVKAVNSSEPIADHLGKTINLKDVVIQTIQMEDERTGEIGDVPRVILVDDKGKSYHAISTVMFNDIKNIIGLLGLPKDWEEPEPIKVVQARSRKGYNIYTIQSV